MAFAAIVVAAIVALLAWARNDPGVDDRDPDPPQSTEVVSDGDTAAAAGTTIVIDAGTVPPDELAPEGAHVD